MDPFPKMYKLDPPRRVQEVWLVSSEHPHVVILTAEYRPQSYQQGCPVALVDGDGQFVVAEGFAMALVGDLLVLYISYLALESFDLARSQSCLPGLLL